MMRKRDNPYDFNFSEKTKIKSVTHVHLYPWRLGHVESQEKIDEGFMALYNRGVRHFNYTDHEGDEVMEQHPEYPSDSGVYEGWVIYPPEKYFTNVPEDALFSPGLEHRHGGYYPTDYHTPAIGSFYNNGNRFADEDFTRLDDGFDAIKEGLRFEGKGGFFIAHNDNPSVVIDYLKKYDSLLGHEIYNDKRSFYLDTWDAILKTKQQCYGFAVLDKYHVPSLNSDFDLTDPDKTKGITHLLVNDYTEKSCEEAYRLGSFYSSLRGDDSVKFLNISYDDNQFNVECEGASEIIVTTAEKTETFSDNYATVDVNDDDIYVRAEAVNNETGERIFSNAVIINSNKRKNTEKMQNYRQRDSFMTLL